MARSRAGGCRLRLPLRRRARHLLVAVQPRSAGRRRPHGDRGHQRARARRSKPAGDPPRRREDEPRGTLRTCCSPWPEIASTASLDVDPLTLLQLSSGASFHSAETDAPQAGVSGYRETNRRRADHRSGWVSLRYLSVAGLGERARAADEPPVDVQLAVGHGRVDLNGTMNARSARQFVAGAWCWDAPFSA